MASNNSFSQGLKFQVLYFFKYKYFFFLNFKLASPRLPDLAPTPPSGSAPGTYDFLLMFYSNYGSISCYL